MLGGAGALRASSTRRPRPRRSSARPCVRPVPAERGRPPGPTRRRHRAPSWSWRRWALSGCAARRLELHRQAPLRRAVRRAASPSRSRRGHRRVAPATGACCWCARAGSPWPGAGRRRGRPPQGRGSATCRVAPRPAGREPAASPRRRGRTQARQAVRGRGAPGCRSEPRGDHRRRGGREAASSPRRSGNGWRTLHVPRGRTAERGRTRWLFRDFLRADRRGSGVSLGRLQATRLPRACPTSSTTGRSRRASSRCSMDAARRWSGRRGAGARDSDGCAGARTSSAATARRRTPWDGCAARRGGRRLPLLARPPFDDAYAGGPTRAARRGWRGVACPPAGGSAGAQGRLRDGPARPARRWWSPRTGQRHVQGRTKAGGQSQQRFARRRDNQARQAYEAAAGHALADPGERHYPDRDGGDHRAVEEVLADPRLRRLSVVAPWLPVPDPRRAVLEQAVTRRVRRHPGRQRRATTPPIAPDQVTSRVAA